MVLAWALRSGERDPRDRYAGLPPQAHQPGGGAAQNQNPGALGRNPVGAPRSITEAPSPTSAVHLVWASVALAAEMMASNVSWITGPPEQLPSVLPKKSVLFPTVSMGPE